MMDKTADNSMCINKKDISYVFTITQYYVFHQTRNPFHNKIMVVMQIPLMESLNRTNVPMNRIVIYYYWNKKNDYKYT